MRPPEGVPPAGPPASPPPRPPPVVVQRSNAGLYTLLALFAGTLMGGTCATCASMTGDSNRSTLFGGRGDRVGVIELTGVIMDATETVANLERFAKRDDLLGIVVRIDSPGGAVAPSQEIYEAMRRASKKKPVVASMGSTAASGGFWASLGADWVFASPGSVTGSIGVITQTPDLRGIAEVLRFRMRTFKSGPLKDAGNPFREMTPEDEALFQSLIDDIYDQFVTATAKRRGLTIEQVKVVADGRVMTGRAALKADLIDELGGLHDAAKKVIVLAKVRERREAGETVTSTTTFDDMDDPKLVYPKKDKPGLLDLLGSATSQAIADGVEGAVDRMVTRSTAPVELR